VDVQELLNKVGQNLSVKRAFGVAYEKSDALIIPVALVAGGGGGGEGTNGGASSSTDEGADTNDAKGSDGDAGAPGGSGGGFGGVVMPVGVYVVKDENVRWVPAVNANLVIVVVFITLIQRCHRARVRFCVRVAPRMIG
jgi:uncharacterized spore protein YtfJ